MAIYHLSVKTISRSAGRSATAAAAYRAGVQITDERTGDVHDYSRRGGVESSELVLPVGAPSWASDRSALWNAAEQAEKRKNSTVAREFEIALPVELSPVERRDLAVSFARELVERHGCAADVCIHAPGKEGDNRNHHAHVLLTTRRLGREGFGEKTRELDEAKTGAKLITQWRERFASMQNERLQAAGIDARVDHRTLADQGIDRAPTVHLGPAAVGYERRTGEVSRKREDWGIEAEAFERLRQAKATGEQERRTLLDQARQWRAQGGDRRQIEQTILYFSSELAAARSEQTRRDRMTVQELDAEIGQLRPLPVRDLVERDPAVVRLVQEVRELSHARDEALRNENTAKDQAFRWRLDSPLRAQLHDRGLFRSKELDQFEQIRVESARAREELTPRLADVRMAESTTRKVLEERLTLEQAPIREQIAELDELRASKAKQEQAERDQRDAERRIERARAEAPEQFKKMADRRQSRLFWRSDDEKALSPALREAIETYNATPVEARPAVLDRLMSEHRDQVIEFQKVRKELDRGR